MFLSNDSAQKIVKIEYTQTDKKVPKKRKLIVVPLKKGRRKKRKSIKSATQTFSEKSTQTDDIDLKVNDSGLQIDSDTDELFPEQPQPKTETLDLDNTKLKVENQEAQEISDIAAQTKMLFDEP